MFKIKTNYITKPIVILISLGITIYALFLIFVAFLISTNGLYNNNLFKPILSESLFILTFIFILLTYLATIIWNKNNWPKVKAKIINVQITKKFSQNYPTVNIKLSYDYAYNYKRYFKTSFCKFDFETSKESENFLKKFSSNNVNYIDVYVFKWYPKLSSVTNKSFIYHIILILLFGFFSVNLFFMGLLYRAIDTGFVKIVTKNTGNGTDTSLALQKSLGNITSIFNMSLVILLMLIIFLFLMYIYQLSKLVIINKPYLGFPIIDPLAIQTTENELFQEKYCQKCHHINDFDSIYCLDCGSPL